MKGALARLIWPAIMVLAFVIGMRWGSDIAFWWMPR